MCVLIWGRAMPAKHSWDHPDICRPPLYAPRELPSRDNAAVLLADEDTLLVEKRAQ